MEEFDMMLDDQTDLHSMPMLILFFSTTSGSHSCQCDQSGSSELWKYVI